MFFKEIWILNDNKFCWCHKCITLSVCVHKIFNYPIHAIYCNVFSIPMYKFVQIQKSNDDHRRICYDMIQWNSSLIRFQYVRILRLSIQISISRKLSQKWINWRIFMILRSIIVVCWHFKLNYFMKNKLDWSGFNRKEKESWRRSIKDHQKSLPFETCTTFSVIASIQLTQYSI